MAVLWVLHERGNRDPIRNLARYAGREFQRRVRMLSYDAVRRRARLPGGAYLFLDHEIVSDERLAFIRGLADHLRDRAPILNDPARALGRFDLLERMYAEGVNPFRAYRAGVPDRWPVFVRDEFDHSGPRSGLLHDAAALEQARVRKPHDAITVEFCETRGPDGLYRKYGACRVGERIFARHLFFGSEWMVKMNVEAPEELLAEERKFVADFPDREEVRRLFEIAGIEYGRIDYSRAPDGLVVWEINSNPMIIDERTVAMRRRWPLNVEVIGRHVDALLELAQKAEGRPAISLKGVDGVRPSLWRRF
ncbi:MAG: hypothetical protein ACYTEG_01195 [Planctomycetota bacterium]|jgi:hypothetical protein